MIRPAAPDDVPAILDLIRELAGYERAPDSVEASEADLHRALFGDRPAVWAHVAEIDATVVGAAIWFLSFSTWTGRHGMHLEDLIVTPSARSRGVGRALFDELRRICVERGYPRLEFQVLDWNTDAGRFYTAQRARPMPEWVAWRLTPDAFGG